MPLRLIFMGTPDFAVPTLLELVAHGHEIAAVYTRAAKPAGRGMKLQPTPVEQEARRLGIVVETPTTLKTPEALDVFRAHDADAAVVVAYGMILPQPILDTPKLGCFNLHASLLPRWRGAAPINRAIMAGDAESGVMVMKMDVGLDTGDVAMAERLAISDAMTAADLHDALAPLGADLMVRAMGALERGKLQLTKQSEEGVTYAAKIEKAEARIDWNRPARDVLRHIHGLSPFPGAWYELAIDGEQVRVKILRCELAKGAGAPGDLLDDRLTIACREGAIRILDLQRAGAKPMKAQEFLRGTPLLLQLFVIYYVLPQYLGIRLPEFWAGVLALGINYSAYEAENYRAGLLAIPRGQMEAALSLGMSTPIALRRIIVPQAMRIVIPPVTNDFIALFKDTSVCTMISIMELTGQYRKLFNDHPQLMLQFGLITALLYLVMSYPLSLVARRMETQFKKATA